MTKPIKKILALKIYPTPTGRVDFVDTPVRRPDYIPERAAPVRAGSMDAFKLPSIEFGKRREFS